MSGLANQGYVVVVDFLVHLDALERFVPAMLENAASSLREEPDCLIFEVCQDPERPERIYLYEVYRSRAAFDCHLRSAHFQSFNDLTQPWVIRKDVRVLCRIQREKSGEL